MSVLCRVGSHVRWLHVAFGNACTAERPCVHLRGVSNSRTGMRRRRRRPVCWCLGTVRCSALRRATLMRRYDFPCCEVPLRPACSTVPCNGSCPPSIRAVRYTICYLSTYNRTMLIHVLMLCFDELKKTVLSDGINSTSIVTIPSWYCYIRVSQMRACFNEPVNEEQIGYQNKDRRPQALSVPLWPLEADHSPK